MRCSAPAARAQRRRKPFASPYPTFRCLSRHRLEYDHVEPFALGGSHAERNLRLVCPQHQRLAAIEAFGAERMARYLRE